MPLEVQPFTIDDVETSFRIGHRAHWSNGGLVEFCFSGSEIHPDTLKQQIEGRTKVMTEQKGTIYMMKVVDTDLPNNQMIAYAQWSVEPNGRTEEELEKSAAVHPAHADTPVPQAWDDLMDYLHDARIKYLGLEPACMLKSLMTDPDHHRRGAGGLLMRWGTQRADELGIRCYLEATPAGKGLYEKHGFQTIYEQKFDLTKYGGKGVQTDCVMERPARSKQ